MVKTGIGEPLQHKAEQCILTGNCPIRDAVSLPDQSEALGFAQELMVGQKIFKNLYWVGHYSADLSVQRINCIETYRSVAQTGSALDWGSRGRGFESRRSDHNTCG